MLIQSWVIAGFFLKRPNDLSPPTTIFRQTFSLVYSGPFKTASSSVLSKASLSTALTVPVLKPYII